MNFVHLHTHSYYSLLQSPSSPESLVKKAKEQGALALGLTDNGVMYGAIEFYKACKKNGIHPVIGMEVYIAPRTLHDKDGKADARYSSLVLLAETQEGYENLLKMSTIAHLEGFYYKPRIDKHILKKYKKGLIALSGHFSGEIAKSILEGEAREKNISIIEEYKEIFGKNNFYLEISHHPNLSGQNELNEALIELGKELDIPLVVGQNVYYALPEDSEAQDILSCIGSNRQVSDFNRSSMIDEDYSLTDPEEVISALGFEKSALDNTVRIADRCRVDFDLGKYHIPEFFPPKNHPTSTPIDYFRYECIEGLKSRYRQFEVYLQEKGWGKSLQESTIVGENDISPSVNNPLSPTGKEIALRFEHEYSIIKKMGFESYFLIVWDYIRWAKENGVLVGPGRGSGAGSIIAYALTITNLEPLRYSLLFERFLNPERISMPDFDIDFQDNKRDDVIQYVSSRYGDDHVAQISTFGTLAARAAIKDVGRVLGVSFAKMNEFSKLIPERPGTSLDDALEQEKQIPKVLESDEELNKVWSIAKKLEGCVRHISVHASAVVISAGPMIHYSALQHPPKDDTTLITQFSAKPLEALGLLKMDFLGLKNLTILDEACKIIKKTTGRIIKLEEIPMNDEKTLIEIFQEGKTTGVFQFESAGIKRYLKELKPTQFEDLIAMNALYRPGPMEFIPDFIKRKHKEVIVKYPHESVENILQSTYGIAVYQEQIMQMAQAFSGYSLGDADLLRKAIGKKIPEVMQEQRGIFIEKAEKLGRSKDLAVKIFDDIIVPFAGYGFNKAHAAAYALVAYQTAYLKAHYPTEFMCALLISDQASNERIAIEIEECESMGIEVLPPSINNSRENFTVVKNKQIRFGLGGVKNLGDSCIRAIIQARGEEEIPFQNLTDFLKRIENSQLNRKNLEALIKSGAMDRMGDRNTLLVNIDAMYAFSKESQEKHKSGQMGIFDLGETPSTMNDFSFPIVPKEKAKFSEKLAWEKECLGLYVSSHPLAGLEAYYKNKEFIELSSIQADIVNTSIKCAGIITGLRVLKTKNNDSMATGFLEDISGKTEITFFPSVFKDFENSISEDGFFIIHGKVDFRNGNIQILPEKLAKYSLDFIRDEADKLGLLERDKKHIIKKQGEKITLKDIENAKREPWYIDIPPHTSKEILQSMKTVFENNPGDYEVILVFPNKQKMPLPQRVNATNILKSHIIQLLSILPESDKFKSTDN